MTDTTVVSEASCDEVHATYSVALMTPKQLVTAVAGLAVERIRLGLKASRSSVGEWRRDLGFRRGPFKMTHAIALAYYGDQLGLKVPKKKAKAMTTAYINSLANQEKHDGK